ncbi:MAG: hypothetical protein JWP94_571 [Mucilaginibacter sp.]|nr:hypothetical protein [Mucilaginibacter sp.]
MSIHRPTGCCRNKSDLSRTGSYAAWRPGYGQPNETAVYKQANQKSPDMIAKGHCQAWIPLAWRTDAAILSDSYTFNAAMEYQGQNIGTELASEELCRELAGHGKPSVTDSVHIWCGTFGNQHVFVGGEVSDVLPAFYYKIIKYRDRVSGQQIGSVTGCQTSRIRFGLNYRNGWFHMHSL